MECINESDTLANVLKQYGGIQNFLKKHNPEKEFNDALQRYIRSCGM